MKATIAETLADIHPDGSRFDLNTETAGRVAAALGLRPDEWDRGTCEVFDFRCLINLRAHRHESYRSGQTRYTFADGSAIVTNPRAWDVALPNSSARCLCFAGNKTHADGCPDLAAEEGLVPVWGHWR